MPPILGVMDESLLPLEEDYQKRLDFVCSRYRVTLNFSGLTFLCRVDDRKLKGHIEERYGKFVTTEKPLCTLDIQTTEKLDFQTHDVTYLTYRRGAQVIGKFRGMAGYFDAKTLAGKGKMEKSAFKQDFENLLRCVLNAAAPVFDMILFHTSCVTREGYGYLFFGPSTAGKSTLTRLSSHYTIMTDDMVILKKMNGRLHAATCGLWGGRTEDYPMIRIEVPVKYFFVLRKAGENRLKKMNSQTALLEFLCNVPCMARDPFDLNKIMSFAQLAVTAYPFHELYFHKENSSFWRNIDELDGTNPGSESGHSLANR